MCIFLALLCSSAGAAPVDQEPTVTAEVADTLQAIAAGQPPQRFTDRGAQDLAAPGLAALLQGCARPPALELLQRTVDGEDRRYVYRTRCGARTLHITVVYNKAARINRLQIEPEH